MALRVLHIIRIGKGENFIKMGNLKIRQRYLFKLSK